MTHIWTISNHRLTCSDFSLKAVIKGFLLFCDRHSIKADQFTLTEYKASHDEQTGPWEEKTEINVWIDPEEGFEAIYEALK